MDKQPSFPLFYIKFLVSTDCMTNEQVGAYIRCLCHQADKNSLSENHMIKICNTQEVHNIIKNKFLFEENTKSYYNSTLKLILEKKQKYSESRSINRLGKFKKTKKKQKTYDYHSDETKNIYTLLLEQGKYKEEEIEIYKKFNEWLQQNATKVLKLEQPITIDEMFKLKEDGYLDRVGYDKLKAMHNCKDLLKKYTSANYTLRNWVKREDERNAGKTN
jgi:hypothetical protein